MNAATSAELLTLPSDWRRRAGSGPVGAALIHPSGVSGCVAVELPQAAAGVLGWPAFVVVELASRELTIMPASAGDIGARETRATRGGGLAFDARIAVKRRALGRWPAWAHGGGLVVDLAGPGMARGAA